MTMPASLRFIDVFAGCGGLSLGLSQAGCQGVFAVEKSPLAFETLRHNLVDGKNYRFAWPTWLPKQATTCEDLISSYGEQLRALRDSIDLIVGGPPCQGFSTAGRRDPADPRNKMTEQYLALVGLVQPRFLVIENVAGFDMRFENEEGLAELITDAEDTSYARYVARRLDEIGYNVHAGLINCAAFGVPQVRHRYLMICERKDNNASDLDLLKALKKSRKSFLTKKHLPTHRFVTTSEAIGDLKTSEANLITNQDSGMRGFLEIDYCPSREPSLYQRLMRIMADGPPNSLRLANHKQSTIDYFTRVQMICRPGRCLSKGERKLVGTKKHATTVLNKNGPAPTITTLPDDILHYDEPRILTVRENARIQSFPDWFAFQGKYTTGGAQRKFECPRYTQVGNAVPPLVAEAIGKVLLARQLSSRQLTMSTLDKKQQTTYDIIIEPTTV